MGGGIQAPVMLVRMPMPGWLTVIGMRNTLCRTAMLLAPFWVLAHVLMTQLRLTHQCLGD